MVVTAYVNTSTLVKIGSLNVSSYVKSATFNTGSEVQDMTGMGLASHVNYSGLKTWSLELELYQSITAGTVDDILGPLFKTPATVIVKVCPGVGGTPTLASATNPCYNGTAVMESYTPIQGDVGSPATCKVVFKAAGDLNRTVSGNWDA